jgi:hypothetical protein
MTIVVGVLLTSGLCVPPARKSRWYNGVLSNAKINSDIH